MTKDEAIAAAAKQEGWELMEGLSIRRYTRERLGYECPVTTVANVKAWAEGRMTFGLMEWPSAARYLGLRATSAIDLAHSADGLAGPTRTKMLAALGLEEPEH